MTAVILQFPTNPERGAPQRGPVPYEECSRLLDFISERKFSFMLHVLEGGTTVEWQTLRDVVHYIKAAEGDKEMSAPKLTNGEPIKCSPSAGKVTVVFGGRLTQLQRTLTPTDARLLAVRLLQAAARAA